MVTETCDSAPPSNGRIGCRRCWEGRDGDTEYVSEIGRFKLVNDPASWGGRRPKVLVLGISKGNTQTNVMNISNFDEVAFKDMMKNLTDVLQTVGVAKDVGSVKELIQADEKSFAWGSVVRCSLTGWDKKKNQFSAESGKVLPAFKDEQMSKVCFNCMDQHLLNLPSELKLIILLGNSEAYVRNHGDVCPTTLSARF